MPDFLPPLGDLGEAPRLPLLDALPSLAGERPGDLLLSRFASFVEPLEVDLLAEPPPDPFLDPGREARSSSLGGSGNVAVSYKQLKCTKFRYLT